MKNFKAHVLKCEPYNGNYAVVLDQTVFYPGGGGQPVDEGYLDTQQVLSVFEEEETIYHVLKLPLEVGKEVTGEIDFNRRFDYMQQHSGEHILSGAIKELHGFNNVGFHLSDYYMTADLDGELTLEELLEVEDRVNQAIYENKPIKAVFYKHTELTEVAYRSKLALEGDIRLVTVENYDICACCGTHVSTTGEIGIVKIVSADKYKGGMRLTVLCGKRALDDYKVKVDTIRQLSAQLSAKSESLVDAVERLKQELNSTKQLLVQRTQILLENEARELKDKGDLCIYREDLNVDEMRKLCSALAEKQEKPCIVTGKDSKGLRYVLGSGKEDIRELCKKLNKQFSGKGGGTASLCQGTLQTEFEALRDYWKGLEEHI